jgi:anaerobic selenocysteine-containing dehydrogenase
MTGDWKSTACILCECNCGIVVQLEGRTLAKIRGDKDHPASQRCAWITIRTTAAG